ncbi:tripartite motif-containing protein 16-like isoform X1 [Cheilinus undulatus]|uniref:tripartite motif-containing protein 16-like isoform X1 n=1 Tax=Cheilinus undulatus TaxID=241271 RepID=UPI001BD6075D|nr:tripartite motif-containing protein 16-like isoform X1 [Cheilinus undulatus]
MAQKGVQLDQETFSCSICLDLLKDPVTVSCGHSYCMKCLQTYWDTEDEKNLYSCPQCRQTFTPRPVLLKNTMLAVLVEELKTSGLQAAPADHCYAGAEDVACDFCSGRKLKAQKSCLQCLASYCQNHLQPHFEVAPLKNHKLVEPSKKLQENVCSRHDEVMKIFCRTDQQSIFLLDEHKGHNTVSAAAERAERQRELEVSRQNIQQGIQDREKDVKLLQQEAEAINCSADKAVEDSQKIFTQLIRLLEKRRSDVTQQVRSQQESQVRRVKELEEKLRQEIAELKRRDGELQTLSQTQDHNQFLHDYPSLSALRQPSRSYTQPEPKTREEFIRYSCDITLDPNTAHTELLLSDGNRKVTRTNQQSYARHPDRFTGEYQVLSRESLTGRCYWEVERRGRVSVAVAYKNISRTGKECGFGRNDKSWSLFCSNRVYYFWYNNVNTLVSGPRSSRVGVYLDHSAGVLSFYSISETMTLLHRVHTTFTQPLHAGLRVCDTAEMCKLK